MEFKSANGLYLRAIELEDTEVLYKIENDVSAWQYSENYTPFSKTVLANYVNGVHDLVTHGQYRFMVCKSENVVLGCVDLFDFKPIHGRAGVGIYILPNYRRQGKALDALGLLTNYAKKILNLSLLHCSILEINHESIGLFKSAGYNETGRRPSWHLFNGERLGVVLLQREL